MIKITFKSFKFSQICGVGACSLQEFFPVNAVLLLQNSNFEYNSRELHTRQGAAFTK